MPSSLVQFVAQGGTNGSDRLRAAVTGPDGSFILAGYTSGNWDGTNSGDEDFAALKLDADGTVRWKWQVGYGGIAPSRYVQCVYSSGGFVVA